MKPKSQGLCEVTLTERFEVAGCTCPTYEGNLGPCRTWLEGGMPNHCVFCDHSNGCHRKLSAFLVDHKGTPEERWVALVDAGLSPLEALKRVEDEEKAKGNPQ